MTKIKGSDFLNAMGISSTNDKVDYLRKQLGEFDFEVIKNKTENQLENRPVQIVENKTKYKGQWIKDTEIREGKGTAIKPDGTIYEGWWANNQANGNGRLIKECGDVMEGHWVNNKLNGKGSVKFANGTIHLGIF